MKEVSYSEMNICSTQLSSFLAQQDNSHIRVGSAFIQLHMVFVNIIAWASRLLAQLWTQKIKYMRHTYITDNN